MTSETQNSDIIQGQIQLAMRLESIFMPHATRQRRAHYENKEGNGNQGRLVHYTSAEAAVGIIRSKRIWMRNTTCMSDYSEVQHGFKILNNYFSDTQQKTAFVDALDVCVPGAAHEAITLFGQVWNDIQSNTYIASISEHDDKEDLHGCLSMWRAFGGNAACVAIVIKVPWYSGGAQALKVFFSPVAYLREEEVHAVIHEVIENVRSNCDFLHSTDRLFVVGTVFNMLVAAVCCLKHEGFHEEREWRVIYAPSRSSSPLMEFSTQIIGGIPQIVYKLPLDMTVSEALAELDVSHLFDRLIIGPSAYSWAMYQAFVAELKEAGVSDAEQRVFISGIPIRS